MSDDPTLFVTYCSADKRTAGRHGPRELYREDRIESFISRCESLGLPWAILSAEHGLVFPEDRHEPYDTYLGSTDGRCRYWIDGERLPEADSRRKLVATIRQVRRQAAANDVSRVVFFDPGRHEIDCYVTLLAVALRDHDARDGVPADPTRVVESHPHLDTVESLAELDRW